MGMICFRDRSYRNLVCETVQCDRNFTPEAKAAAEKWWEMFKMPGEAPVHFTDTYAKRCGEYRPPVATHTAKALDAVPTHDILEIR
jgi:hypothetical protein